MAHAEAFARDLTTIANMPLQAADACSMGSGAHGLVARSRLDPPALAKELGFSRITANSLDAVKPT